MTRLTKEQLLSVLPLLARHLASDNPVVYTYTAVAIERILVMRSAGGGMMYVLFTSFLPPTTPCTLHLSPVLATRSLPLCSRTLLFSSLEKYTIYCILTNCADGYGNRFTHVGV